MWLRLSLKPSFHSLLPFYQDVLACSYVTLRFFLLRKAHLTLVSGGIFACAREQLLHVVMEKKQGLHHCHVAVLVYRLECTCLRISGVSGIKNLSWGNFLLASLLFDWRCTLTDNISIFFSFYLPACLCPPARKPFNCSMKSTAFLTVIMTINWIFEIISFYNETSSTMFDIINALQGVLIFLMFVCLPRPMKLIQAWYKDRGSFEVLPDNDLRGSHNKIQMKTLSPRQWVRSRYETGATRSEIWMNGWRHIMQGDGLAVMSERARPWHISRATSPREESPQNEEGKNPPECGLLVHNYEMICKLWLWIYSLLKIGPARALLSMPPPQRHPSHSQSTSAVIYIIFIKLSSQPKSEGRKKTN